MEPRDSRDKWVHIKPIKNDVISYLNSCSLLNSWTDFLLFFPDGGLIIFSISFFPEKVRKKSISDHINIFNRSHNMITWNLQYRRHVAVKFHLYNYSISRSLKLLNQFQPSVAFHIETSYLICRENQINGFYMKCNTRLKWIKNLAKVKNEFIKPKTFRV